MKKDKYSEISIEELEKKIENLSRDTEVKRQHILKLSEELERLYIELIELKDTIDLRKNGQTE